MSGPPGPGDHQASVFFFCPWHLIRLSPVHTSQDPLGLPSSHGLLSFSSSALPQNRNTCSFQISAGLDCTPLANWNRTPPARLSQVPAMSLGVCSGINNSAYCDFRALLPGLRFSGFHLSLLPVFPASCLVPHPLCRELPLECSGLRCELMNAFRAGA